MTSLAAALSIRDWPKDDQPVEKLTRSGPEGLSDTELLAILIRTGHKASGQNPLDIARRIVMHFQGLSHLASRELTEISRITGMSRRKAAQVLAAIELGRRVNTPTPDRIAFSSSVDVGRHYVPKLQHRKQEVFKVLLLDARNRLIKEVTVSEGTLTASIVHPREVFKPAVIESAASVIVLHNHPSGDPTPSPDDLRITQQLVEAGAILDIRVLDHIIVGHDDFLSMAGKGLI
jgi:DNA repair protein RadC